LFLGGFLYVKLGEAKLLSVGKIEKQPVSGKKKNWLDVAEKIG
jgi:hypothetical protein